MLVSQIICLATLVCNYIVVNNDKTVMSCVQLGNWLLAALWTNLLD